MQDDVRALALRAKAASRSLCRMEENDLREVVRSMARALEARCDDILAANALDMEAGESAGMSAGLLDRLRLDESRVKGMAEGLRALSETPSMFGPVRSEARTIDDGTIPGLEGVLTIARVPVPLGVVAMVYEARPNVTADAAGACLRSGNACVLRGGSQAINSNRAIADALRSAVASRGLPADCVCLLDSTDRAATDELMRLRGVVDVLVPRGGAGLIRHCVETSLVPVIETGTGNCHIYVHEAADFSMARSIVMNAKTQRVGVCNAAETLLVDESIASGFLPRMLSDLVAAGVTVHGDAVARECAERADSEGISKDASVLAHFEDATEDDWAREYLAMDIAVHAVGGLDEAISHINVYGTGHSEAIVTSPDDSARRGGGTPAARFLEEVDAAAVYVNASTRFTDGGCFGLGAEIGISTQKLHARGPFSAENLLTYKYEVIGTGQVRP